MGEFYSIHKIAWPSRNVSPLQLTHSVVLLTTSDEFLLSAA